MLRRSDSGAGDVLFARGSLPAGVWIIKEGWIELVLDARRREGVIGMMGPRQCVGEIPLILEVPAPYSAIAATDVSSLFMPAKEFTRFLRKNPTFALRWTSKLAGRVARSQGRVVQLLAPTLKERVARLLLHESYDGVFPFAQETCAAMLGASRSPVNQVLKAFERQHVIRLRYGRIEICDERGLSTLARDGG